MISVLHALWVHNRDHLEQMVKDIGSHIEVKLRRHTVWVHKRFPSWASQPVWASAIEAAAALLMGGPANIHGGKLSVACELLGIQARELTGPLVAIFPTGGGLHAVCPLGAYELNLEPNWLW